MAVIDVINSWLAESITQFIWLKVCRKPFPLLKCGLVINNAGNMQSGNLIERSGSGNYVTRHCFLQQFTLKMAFMGDIVIPSLSLSSDVRLLREAGLVQITEHDVW